MTSPDTSPEAVEHLVRYLTFNGLHEQSALVRALSGELARAREWQPIETAPKDGTRILLWLADEGFSLTASWRMPPIQMEGDELCWWSFEHDMDIGGIHDITHWMPLPQGPYHG